MMWQRYRIGYYAVLFVLGIYIVLVSAPVGGPEMSERYFKEFKLSDKHLPVFYSPHYNISFWGIERLHPFDSQKYGRVYKMLLKNEVLKKWEVAIPKRPSRDVLLKVHTKDYLKRLKSAAKLAQITEIGMLSMIPWRLTYRKVLIPMQYATGGTILAAKAAMQKGWAMNLGGGYHHAYAADGGGFCVYADISLAIKNLLESETAVKKVMIIDLDAHQGNGPERDFVKRKDIFIMDMYNRHIYPDDSVAKDRIDLKVELEMFIEDEEYLFLLIEALKQAFESFSPDIIFYIAGTDSLAGDPLGLMSLSRDGIIQRDALVFKAAIKRKIPIVMLLAGGYQKTSAPIIADSIQNLFSFFKERASNIP